MRSWQEDLDIRRFDIFAKSGGGYEPIFNKSYAEAKDTQAATAIALYS